MYRKIVIAYDGSDSGRAALHQAAALAGLCQAELHVVSIVATTGGLGLAEAVGPGDVWGMECERLQRMLDAVVVDLRGQGLCGSAFVRQGDPATEIAAHAREIGADLVVLGHAGKGVLLRLLEGSVGGRLLGHLPCSLLVAVAP